MGTHRRIVSPTPRHLDDPLEILGLAVSQWVAAGLGVLILWAVLDVGQRYLSLATACQLGCLLGGIPVLAATIAHLEGVSVTTLTRRLARYLGPKEYVPGPPERGPLALALVERPLGDDDSDDY